MTLCKKKRKMERQIDNFRFRIQRELTIIDDEIARMQNLNNFYNEKIEESKDKLRKLSFDIDNLKVMRGGIAGKRIAAFGIIESRAKNIHFQRIKQLEAFHKEDIRCLQEEFQSKMTEITTNADLAVKTKITEIEKRKKKLTEFKKELTSKLTHISATNFWENSDENSELDEVRIEELRKRVVSLNAERLSSLNKNKMKLEKCVETLDEIENRFKTLFNEKILQIQSLDYRHKMDVTNITRQHENEMSVLRLKLKNVKNVSDKIERTRQSVIAQGQSRVSIALDEFRLTQTTRKAMAEQGDEELDHNENLKFVLENKKKALQNSEAALYSVREQNMTLKRQIEEKKHQQRFGIH